MATSSRPTILQTMGGLVFCGAVLAGTLRYTLCDGTAPRLLEKRTGIACRDGATCRGQLHAAAVCRRNECVPLATNECEVVADPVALERDDTVWLGAMFPRAPAPEAAELRANVKRAQREATERGGAGQGRALGVILCDDDVAPDPAAPTRIAAHLDDVGVPAIIGFRSTEEAMQLASVVARPALVILAREADPLAAPRVPDNVWRLTWDTESTARAIASLVRDELEPQHRKRNDGDGAALRVAVVRLDHEAGATFAKALSRHLAPLETRGVTLRTLTYGAEKPTYDAMIDALVALKPHVVLYAGEAIGFLPVILGVEQSWPATSAWRPRYVGIGAPDPDVVERLDSLAKVGVTPQVSAVVPKRLSAAREAVALVGDAIRALGPGEPVTGPAIAKVLALGLGNMGDGRRVTPLDPGSREATGVEQVIVTVGPSAVRATDGSPGDAATQSDAAAPP